MHWPAHYCRLWDCRSIAWLFLFGNRDSSRSDIHSSCLRSLMRDCAVLHQKTHRTNTFGCLFSQTRHVHDMLVFHSLLKYATSGLVTFAWTTFTNIGSVLVYFQCVYAPDHFQLIIINTYMIDSLLIACMRHPNQSDRALLTTSEYTLPKAEHNLLFMLN